MALIDSLTEASGLENSAYSVNPTSVSRVTAFQQNAVCSYTCWHVIPDDHVSAHYIQWLRPVSSHLPHVLDSLDIM